jgi:hypothetical protein
LAIFGGGLVAARLGLVIEHPEGSIPELRGGWSHGRSSESQVYAIAEAAGAGMGVPHSGQRSWLARRS